MVPYNPSGNPVCPRKTCLPQGLAHTWALKNPKNHVKSKEFSTSDIKNHITNMDFGTSDLKDHVKN